MSVGFLCNRRRIIDGVAIKGLTELLVLIVTPCIIMHSFMQQTFAPSLLGDLGWALVASVFAHVVGSAIAILFFAFSTVLGWSQYGSKGFEYLFGTKTVKIYQSIFVVFILVGATIDLTLAWDLSDTFNGMMAIPNLIGVIALSGTVMKITKNYVDRKIKGKKIEPMLSAIYEIQEQHLKEVS